MDIKNIFLEWIIPPGFMRIKNKYFPFPDKQLYRQSKKELFTAKNSLDKFKNSYLGERCFILATGPSIKYQNLKLLANEHCISVSQFHLHPDIDIIKPIWHVLAPCHPPFQFDTDKKIFDSIKTAFKNFKDINFILGNNEYRYSYYNYLQQNDIEFLNRFESAINFVDYSKSISIDESNFEDEKIWDISNKPFAIRTVIYSAIQLAFFLGFKEIYLVGCDHDYLNDIARTENHHFYEESKSFSDKEHLASFSKERWFYEYYMRWKDYRLIGNFLEKKNVKIINATKGGMLDVFPRVEYEKIFEK